jgi:hypothetical protein
MSNNLIYCIECTKCHIQYVGETKRSVEERFQGHFYNTSTNRSSDTIGRSAHHNGFEDISIHIDVEFMHTPSDHKLAKATRLEKESNWIHRLCTVSPTVYGS